MNIDSSTLGASLVVIAFNERARAPQCVRSILAQETDRYV